MALAIILLAGWPMSRQKSSSAIYRVWCRLRGWLLRGVERVSCASYAINVGDQRKFHRDYCCRGIIANWSGRLGQLPGAFIAVLSPALIFSVAFTVTRMPKPRATHALIRIRFVAAILLIFSLAGFQSMKRPAVNNFGIAGMAIGCCWRLRRTYNGMGFWSP